MRTWRGREGKSGVEGAGKIDGGGFFCRGRLGHELPEALLYLGFCICIPVAGVQLDGDAAVGQACIGADVEDAEVAGGLGELHVDDAAVHFVMEAAEEEFLQLFTVRCDAGGAFLGDDGELVVDPDAGHDGAFDFQQVEHLAEGVDGAGRDVDADDTCAGGQGAGGVCHDYPVAGTQLQEVGGYFGTRQVDVVEDVGSELLAASQSGGRKDGSRLAKESGGASFHSAGVRQPRARGSRSPAVITPGRVVKGPPAVGAFSVKATPGSSVGLPATGKSLRRGW